MKNYNVTTCELLKFSKGELPNVRLCSIYIGLCRALQRCCVENTLHTEGSVVWSCEAVGRYLHYYLDLASWPLRHNDITASHVSFIPFDTDTVSTKLVQKWEGGGGNLLVGGRGRPDHVIPSFWLHERFLVDRVLQWLWEITNRIFLSSII